MPHVGGGSSDDLASSDEVIVFKHEGAEAEQKESDEILTDDKSSLITEGETEKPHIPCQSYTSTKNAHGVARSDSSPEPGKSFEGPHSIGYMVSPYSHANGALGSMASKVVAGMVHAGAGSSVSHHPASPLPFMVYGGDAFAQPPPAHMGIPPVHIDPKTGIPLVAFQSLSWKDVLEQQGIPRPPMYPLGPPGQYPHHIFSPDFAPQLQWPLFPRHPPSMYPMGGTTGFRGPYPTGLSAAAAAAAVSAAGLPRFPPPALLPPHVPHPHHPHHHPHLHPPHPGMSSSPSASTSAIITPGPKQELLPHLQQNCRHPSYSIAQKPLLKLTAAEDTISHNNNNNNSNNNNSTNTANNNNSTTTHNSNANHHNVSGHHNHHHRSTIDKNIDKKGNHIKKPLNAFMLYMKEMRAKVVAECTLKESAAINQILGRRWHSLSREEQAKYYEMARKERQLHMQLYPGWSARDNYALNTKKKKRKRDKTQDGDGNNPKKCRARYGLDQQSNWCKPCRRKKKCIRYMDGMTESGGDDNLGSVESIEAPTPDSARTSDQDSDPLNTSSELSLSSPPELLEKPSVLMDNGLLAHPLSIHNLSQSVVLSSSVHSDSTDLPQLPTPPSTDSSTTSALLTVT